MNPDRLIVGLAVAFGTPSRNGRIWRAEQFETLLSAGFAVPMWQKHEKPADASEHLGNWRAFSVVPEGTTPPGIVALGEFNHSPAGQALLELITADLNPWTSTGKPWGLSIGFKPGDHGDVHVEELSLETNPAHDLTPVLGVGQYAGDVWTLLTGQPVPTVVTAPRAVRGRLLGLVGGKPVYEEWQE